MVDEAFPRLVLSSPRSLPRPLSSDPLLDWFPVVQGRDEVFVCGVGCVDGLFESSDVWSRMSGLVGGVEGAGNKLTGFVNKVCVKVW